MGTDRYNLNIPELYAMYQDGWSLRRLGALVGCNGLTIGDRFRRHNLPIEPYHHKIGPKYLAYWLSQGMTQTAIAKRLGVHRTCVAKRVIAYRKQGLIPPSSRKTKPAADAEGDAPAASDDAE